VVKVVCESCCNLSDRAIGDSEPQGGSQNIPRLRVELPATAQESKTPLGQAGQIDFRWNADDGVAINTNEAANLCERCISFGRRQMLKDFRAKNQVGASVGKMISGIDDRNAAPGCALLDCFRPQVLGGFVAVQTGIRKHICQMAADVSITGSEVDNVPGIGNLPGQVQCVDQSPPVNQPLESTVVIPCMARVCQLNLPTVGFHPLAGRCYQNAHT
jgi:hypothetical protein